MSAQAGSLTVPIVPEAPKKTLSKLQAEVLALALSPEKPNILITGGPGVGKSTLILELITQLSKLATEECEAARNSGVEMPPYAVVVTAYTGVAALNIDGITIHSFAGVGIHYEQSAQTLAKKITSKEKEKLRWLATRTIIIDEVSMMTGVHLTKLEEIARIVRESDAPFGGMQVIGVGDFAQLPPVTAAADGFFFDSECFDRVFGSNLYELNEIFRTKDSRLINLIKGLREGEITSGQIDALKSKVTKVVPPGATVLFPVKSSVRAYNSDKLVESCTGPYACSISMDFVNNTLGVPADIISKQLLQLTVPRALCLRKGARVMLLKNFPNEFLANGSTGTILDFVKIPLAMWNSWSIMGLSDKGAYQRIPVTHSCKHLIPEGAPDTDTTCAAELILTEAKRQLPRIKPSGILMANLPSLETHKMVSVLLPIENTKPETIKTFIGNIKLGEVKNHNEKSATVSLSLSTAEEEDGKTNNYYNNNTNAIVGTTLKIEQTMDCIWLPIVSFPPLRGGLVPTQRQHEEIYIVGPSAFEVLQYITTPGPPPTVLRTPAGYRYQIPLDTVWAGTIHKVQGLTLDKVHVDLGTGIFASGQTMVAISRVRTWDGLTFSDFSTRSVGKVEPRVKSIMQYIRQVQDDRERQKLKRDRGGSDDESDNDDEDEGMAKVARNDED